MLRSKVPEIEKYSSSHLGFQISQETCVQLGSSQGCGSDYPQSLLLRPQIYSKRVYTDYTTPPYIGESSQEFSTRHPCQVF